jgi:hypothetical protein
VIRILLVIAAVLVILACAIAFGIVLGVLQIFCEAGVYICLG